MRQQRQQSRARAQASRKQNEERQLLLRIHRELMKRRQNLTIGAFSTEWIWKEEMALLRGKWNYLKCSLPSAFEQVERAIDRFPVTQVEE